MVVGGVLLFMFALKMTIDHIAYAYYLDYPGVENECGAAALELGGFAPLPGPAPHAAALHRGARLVVGCAYPLPPGCTRRPSASACTLGDSVLAHT